MVIMVLVAENARATPASVYAAVSMFPSIPTNMIGIVFAPRTPSSCHVFGKTPLSKSLVVVLAAVTLAIMVLFDIPSPYKIRL